VQKKTAAEDKVAGVAIMTPDERWTFRLSQSDVAAEAWNWSLTGMEHITMQPGREINGFTTNETKRFKEEFCISMIEYNAKWDTIGIQEL
jgi:hypothetical protein